MVDEISINDHFNAARNSEIEQFAEKRARALASLGREILTPAGARQQADLQLKEEATQARMKSLPSTEGKITGTPEGDKAAREKRRQKHSKRKRK